MFSDFLTGSFFLLEMASRLGEAHKDRRREMESRNIIPAWNQLSGEMVKVRFCWCAVASDLLDLAVHWNKVTWPL